MHYQVLVAIWLLMVVCEGMKTVTETAKGAAKATIIGKVFSIVDGVISGVFDKQGKTRMVTPTRIELVLPA